MTDQNKVVALMIPAAVFGAVGIIRTDWHAYLLCVGLELMALRVIANQTTKGGE